MGLWDLTLKKQKQKKPKKNTNMKDDPVLLFFLIYFFTFLTVTLKNLNFAVGTPKLRNWGGVQVS